MGKKIATCIRERSNWAKLQEAHKLDSPKFNPEKLLEDLPEASPKLQALLQNIHDLDKRDQLEHGHTFKHFIYSDLKSGYGAKIVASALVASGFTHAYGLGKGARGKTFVLAPPTPNAFAMLTTVAFFQKPLGIQFRKDILKRFNRRPENTYGEEMRIVILDSGLREGVDLFDVKYVHLFEPILTLGDQKQAVGRATRFCGQKGLVFDNGWPLHVYRYDTEGLFDIFLEHSDIDPKKLQLAKELDSVVIEAAVDRELTQAIHGVVTTDQEGGAKELTAKELAAKRVADVRRAAIERARQPFYEKRRKEEEEAIRRYQEKLRELHIQRLKEESEARQRALEEELRRKEASAERRRLEAERREAERLRQEASAERRRVEAERLRQEASAERRRLEAERLRQEASAERRRVEARRQEVRRLVRDAVVREARARQAEAKAIAARRQEVRRLVRDAVIREARARLEAAEAQRREAEALLAAAEAERREAKRREEEAIYHEWWIKFGQRPLPPAPPTTLDDIHTYVRENYKDCVWPPVELKNGCESAGIPGSLEFSPTQNFIRHYLTPKSPYHGLLAYHSVGTGKTCLAIATATTHFEPEGWTILYVTKTTLRGDVWKNMFGQICSLVLQEKVRNGFQIPTDKNAQTRLLSKSWSVLPPLSYRQFSNVLKGKGQLAAKLRAANGTRDPLQKTLIVIDEAHKLFAADTPPSEKCDIKTVVKALHHSYHTSKEDAVKLLLMTGTPYTDDPMAMIRLLNLLYEPEDKLPETFSAFAKTYLDAVGHFTEAQKHQFQNKIAGVVSYLNRENDRRTFSYPIFYDWKVPLATEAKYQKDLQAALSAHQREIMTFKETMEALETEMDESLQVAENELKECKERLPVVLKCKKDVEKTYDSQLAAAAKICDKEAYRRLSAEKDAALLTCAAMGRDTCDPLKEELALLKDNVKTRRSLLKEQWKTMEKKTKDLKKSMEGKKKDSLNQKTAIEECIADK